MGDVSPRKSRRLRVFAVVVAAVAVLAAVAAYVIAQFVPDHRMAIVADASAGARNFDDGAADFTAVAGAIGSVVRNLGDDDALSLRRFGGTCGDADNTAELVRSGLNQGQQVGNAVEKISATGEATLESGVLAAIEDFAGLLPFKGRKSNRIIVVTSHGVDACSGDQERVRANIRRRVDAAGLRLDFRFVGVGVPADQQQDLDKLADALGGPKPRHVQSTQALAGTLKEFLVPSDELAQVVVPSSSPGAPPSRGAEPTKTTGAQAPPWAYIMGIWWRDGKVDSGDSFSFDGVAIRWGPLDPDDFLICRGTVADLYSSTTTTLECTSGLQPNIVRRNAKIDLTVSGNVLTIRGDQQISGTYMDNSGINPLRPKRN